MIVPHPPTFGRRSLVAPFAPLRASFKRLARDRLLSHGMGEGGRTAVRPYAKTALLLQNAEFFCQLSTTYCQLTNA